MGFKTGSTAFGSFDFAEELAKLCRCESYAHLFADKPLPTLAVYRTAKGCYRGFARPGLSHIHLSIGPYCLIGEAKELIAHETAHIIIHRLGLEVEHESGWTGYHTPAFDRVLRTLAREVYGVDLVVGNRQHRYDYSHRLAKHLCETLPDGKVYIRQLEAAPEHKNEKRQPDALFGWTIERGCAKVNLRAKQKEAIEFILDHCYRPTEGTIPTTLKNSTLRVPLHEESIMDFIRCLNSYWASSDGSIETALANRSRAMWFCVKQQRQPNSPC